MQRTWLRGAGTLVMSGQENKGKVCTRHENVSSIRSEINFEVNAILADTDLLQIHDIFMEVIFSNFLRMAHHETSLIRFNFMNLKENIINLKIIFANFTL